ncbi:hypothetical protein C453_08133 [Haloferax elongans ATCC BAA-1513]|uniref:Uncharacterized protein n=1 Tax=Haloferax elongans ATCC BAA-1513 TaxID=1230453 RepID=M0HPS9_HALEO|nr:hypothetical protein [Haloferax elongans]ELZ85768.1 hypothetical protein C453_08133 [Haloferax elongans ATCC BAA-1513]
MTRDRGVSEVVSFVLVFALVTTSVGLVSSLGYVTLSDLQSAQQADNGALAFEVLAADIDAIESGRAETQSADVGTSDGSLGVNPNETVVVTIDGQTWNASGSVFFHSDDARVSYESGAVVRQSEDDAVMIAPPDFTCRDGAAIVSLVDIETTDSSSISGSSVRVITRRQSSRLLYPSSRIPIGTVTVNVSVQGDSSDALARHFAGGDWVYDSGTETASCENVDRVVVRKTTISVEFRV